MDGFVGNHLAFFFFFFSLVCVCVGFMVSESHFQICWIL